jgi:CRISPR/Cas system-associated protein Csm6
MTTIIRNSKFTRLNKGAKPDSKNRVVLPKNLIGEDVIYHIYSNTDGQILLDPQVTLPASELWLFKNPDLLASLKQGLADAARGKATKIEAEDL